MGAGRRGGWEAGKLGSLEAGRQGRWAPAAELLSCWLISERRRAEVGRTDVRGQGKKFIVDRMGG